jgi:hypothetical protein
MKHLAVLLIAAFISSIAMAQQQYEERVYVYDVKFGSSSETPGSNLLEECAAAQQELFLRTQIQPLDNTIAWRGQLYGVRVSAVDGRATRAWTRKQIGKILICHDWDTYYHALGQTIVPVFYEINIGDLNVVASGASVHPSFPDVVPLPGGGQIVAPAGFPEFFVTPMTFSATVMPSVPGEIGGSLTDNFLGDWEDSPNWRFKSTQMLRLFIPVKDAAKGGN